MKKILIPAVILIVAIIAAVTITLSRSHLNTISYTQFIRQVETGQVSDVQIQAHGWAANRATVHLKDGAINHTVLPPDYSAALQMLQNGFVNIEIQDVESNPYRILASATPFLLLLAFWVVLMLNRRRFLRWRD